MSELYVFRCIALKYGLCTFYLEVFKMKKKISLSFIMIIISIFVFGVLNVSAATSGSYGDNITWTLDNSGTLTISGTGEIIDPPGLLGSIPWYDQRTKIKNIVIEEGVTKIGKSAFIDCINVTSVKIPDSVTTIGNYAFQQNIKLSEISIPENTTHIGDAVFRNCSNLSNLELSNCVTSIGKDAFYNTNLSRINIPDSVINIGDNAFGTCQNMIYICVDENNANYSSKDGVLFDKNKTTLIKYPSGKTYSEYVIPNTVTSISSEAFSYSSNLTGVTFNNNIKIIEEFTFRNCTMLTSITIPEGVTTISEYAFGWCTALSSVSIPKSAINIDKYAFCGCEDITIKSYANAYALVYAKNNNIDYSIIEEKIGVVIRDENNDVVGSYDFTKNTVIDTMILSSKNGYSASLYKDINFTEEWDITEPLSKDMVLYIKYSINQYMYKFLNYDGSILKEKTVDYGTIIVPPANPTRPKTQQYTYEFNEWDGYEMGMMQPAENVVFIAQYNFVENPISIYENLEQTETIIKHSDEYTEIEIKTSNIAENTVLIVALYEDNKLVYTDIKFNHTASTSTSITFNKFFDTVKVMNFSSLKNLKPIYNIYDTTSVCIVDFDLNYENAVGAPKRQIVEKGNKIPKPANPSRKNYTFIGWFIDYECTKPYNFDDIPKDNTVLYAKWESIVDKAYNTLGNYFVNYGITADNTEYYLKYTNSGTTYFVVYNKSQKRFFFVSKNPDDHNYSCSVGCDKNSITQEIFVSYANNGRNTPWGLIETAKFSSSNRELLSYQYEGFDADNSSYYKSVLISKAISTLNGARKIIADTGLGITLADLGFLNY